MKIIVEEGGKIGIGTMIVVTVVATANVTVATVETGMTRGGIKQRSLWPHCPCPLVQGLGCVQGQLSPSISKLAWIASVCFST